MPADPSTLPQAIESESGPNEAPASSDPSSVAVNEPTAPSLT